jgi:hypothetical protein
MMLNGERAPTTRRSDRRGDLRLEQPRAQAQWISCRSAKLSRLSSAADVLVSGEMLAME